MYRETFGWLVNGLAFYTMGAPVAELAAGQESKERYQDLIWDAIKRGDEQAVKDMVKNDPRCLGLRGDVGETPLHWCFLYYRYEQREIAFHLLKNFKYLAKDTYEGEKYCGENVLHMAIVHRDFQMVKFLAENEPSLVHGKATGEFFLPPSPCYYGEVPICFAACTNQKEMVDYLLANGANLSMTDSRGNSIFHLLVLHGLVEMYDYIESLWDQHGEKEKPEKLLNRELLSPLTFAASLGQKEMFEHLLEKKGIIMEWHFGPTSLSLHPLDELDYIPDAQVGQKSAIQLLVDKEHVDLLMLPRVQAILGQKWAKYAHKLFFHRLVFAVMYFSLFTATIIFTDCAETAMQQLLFKVANGIVLVVAILKLSVETREIFSCGVHDYFGTKGSMFLENVTSLVFCLCLCIVYLSRLVSTFRIVPPTNDRPTVEPIMLALASIFGWCYILFFFLGFRLTGPFVVMIFRMLVGDVLRFVSIYSVFLMGFSTAFYVLWGQSGPMAYIHQLESNFLMMVGDFDTFYGHSSLSQNRVVAIFFMIFYIVLVTILLVNLLIAMMGSTYSTISEAADKQWLLEWARIIYSLEHEMPVEQREKLKYWEEKEMDGVRARYIRVYDANTRYKEKWAEEAQFEELTFSRTARTVTPLTKTNPSAELERRSGFTVRPE